MKKFIFFIAALSALLSCVKENPVADTPVVDTPVVETPAEETFSVEIRATAPSSGDDAVAANRNTKTTLVDGVGNNGEPKKFVHWSKGDAIKVLLFPKHNINASFDAPSGVFYSHLSQDSAKSAGFRCDAWSWGSTILQNGISYSLNGNGIAVYPSTATAVSKKPSGNPMICDTEVSFVLPSTQNAVKNNIEKNLNFSYAAVSLNSIQQTIENGADTDVTFNNACAMIELTMPSALDKKVTSISIASNNNVPLTGKGVATMSYYKNEIDSNPYDSASDHIFKPEISDGAGVTLNNANGFEAGAKYYVVVWPGEHGSGLTIEFSAEDGTKATKTTGKVELTASHVKPYSFNKGLVFESSTYDYVYSDGSLGNEPNPSGKSVVGVIFFNGNPRENDPALPEHCTNGLAIGLKDVTTVWNSSKLPNKDYANDNLAATSSGALPNGVWGYYAKTKWEKYNLSLYDTSTYGSLPSNTSGWYHATNMEWGIILSDFDHVKSKLLEISADAISPGSNSWYWLPFAYSTGYGSYMYLSGTSPQYKISNYITRGYKARPIFAF